MGADAKIPMYDENLFSSSRLHSGESVRAYSPHPRTGCVDACLNDNFNNKNTTSIDSSILENSQMEFQYFSNISDKQCYPKNSNTDATKRKSTFTDSKSKKNKLFLKRAQSQSPLETFHPPKTFLSSCTKCCHPQFTFKTCGQHVCSNLNCSDLIDKHINLGNSWFCQTCQLAFSDLNYKNLQGNCDHCSSELTNHPNVINFESPLVQQYFQNQNNLDTQDSKMLNKSSSEQLDDFIIEDMNISDNEFQTLEFLNDNDVEEQNLLHKFDIPELPDSEDSSSPIRLYKKPNKQNQNKTETNIFTNASTNFTNSETSSSSPGTPISFTPKTTNIFPGRKIHNRRTSQKYKNNTKNPKLRNIENFDTPDDQTFEEFLNKENKFAKKKLSFEDFTIQSDEDSNCCESHSFKITYEKCQHCGFSKCNNPPTIGKHVCFQGTKSFEHLDVIKNSWCCRSCRLIFKENELLQNKNSIFCDRCHATCTSHPYQLQAEIFEFLKHLHTQKFFMLSQITEKELLRVHESFSEEIPIQMLNFPSCNNTIFVQNLMKLTSELLWHITITSEKPQKDQQISAETCFLIVQQNDILQRFVHIFYNVKNQWYHESTQTESEDKFRKEIDVASMYNLIHADNTIDVWNLETHNKTFNISMQYYREKFIKLMKKMKNLSSFSKKWNLSCKELRKKVQICKTNFIKPLVNIYPRTQVAIEVNKILHLKKSEIYEIYDTLTDVSVLGDSNFIVPIPLQMFIEELEKTSDYQNYTKKSSVSNSVPFADKIYNFMRTQSNWYGQSKQKIWNTAKKVYKFDSEQKQQFHRLRKIYQQCLGPMCNKYATYAWQEWQQINESGKILIEPLSSSIRKQDITYEKTIENFIKYETWWKWSAEKQWEIAQMYGFSEDTKGMFFTEFQNKKFNFPISLQQIFRVSNANKKEMMQIFVQKFPWYFYAIGIDDSRNVAQKLSSQFFGIPQNIFNKMFAPLKSKYEVHRLKTMVQYHYDLWIPLLQDDSSNEELKTVADLARNIFHISKACVQKNFNNLKNEFEYKRLDRMLLDSSPWIALNYNEQKAYAQKHFCILNFPSFDIWNRKIYNVNIQQKRMREYFSHVTLWKHLNRNEQVVELSKRGVKQTFFDNNYLSIKFDFQFMKQRLISHIQELENMEIFQHPFKKIKKYFNVECTLLSTKTEELFSDILQQCPGTFPPHFETKLKYYQSCETEKQNLKEKILHESCKQYSINLLTLKESKTWFCKFYGIIITKNDLQPHLTTDGLLSEIPEHWIKIQEKFMNGVILDIPDNKLKNEFPNDHYKIINEKRIQSQMRYHIQSLLDENYTVKKLFCMFEFDKRHQYRFETFKSIYRKEKYNDKYYKCLLFVESFEDNDISNYSEEDILNEFHKINDENIAPSNSDTMIKHIFKSLRDVHINLNQTILDKSSQVDTSKMNFIFNSWKTHFNNEIMKNETLLQYTHKKKKSKFEYTKHYNLRLICKQKFREMIINNHSKGLQMHHFNILFNYFKNSSHYPQLPSKNMNTILEAHNKYFENYDLFACAHCGYNATLKTHKTDNTKSKSNSRLHLWHSNNNNTFHKLHENDERNHDPEKWFGFQLDKDATFNGCCNERKFLIHFEDNSYVIPLCTKCFKNPKTYNLQDHENRNCEKLLQ